LRRCTRAQRPGTKKLTGSHKVHAFSEAYQLDRIAPRFSAGTGATHPPLLYSVDVEAIPSTTFWTWTGILTSSDLLQRAVPFSKRKQINRSF